MEVVVADKGFFGGASNCTTSDEADEGGCHKHTIGTVLQQQEGVVVKHERFDSPTVKRIRHFENRSDTRNVDGAGLVGGEDRTTAVVKSELMLESAGLAQTPQNVQLVKFMLEVTIILGKYSVGVCLPAAASDGFTHCVHIARRRLRSL